MQDGAVFEHYPPSWVIHNATGGQPAEAVIDQLDCFRHGQ
jgi:hypothetical protein